MENVIYFPAEGNRRTIPQAVITKGVQGNDVGKYKHMALQATGFVLDLTGATSITGTRTDVGTGLVYNLTGTISITHASNGEFEWTPSSTDTGLAGTFNVQFTVVEPGGNRSSYAAIWNVEPLASATAVGAPPLVGVPSDEAALLALLKMITDGASLNEILTFDGAGGFFAGTGGSGGGLHLMENPPLTTGWLVDIVPSVDGIGGGGLMQNITPNTIEYKIDFANHPVLSTAQQAVANDLVAHGYLRILDASFTANNIEVYAAPLAAVAGTDPIIATGDGDASGNIIIPLDIQMDTNKCISISTRNTPVGSTNLTVVYRLNRFSKG